jgi:hypothetical protein
MEKEEYLEEDMEADDGYIPDDVPQRRTMDYGEQLDFTRELLNKDDLKDKISTQLHLYFHTFQKNLAISNFSDVDIQNMILRFDDMKTAFLMRYPPGAFTFDIEEQFTGMRITMCAELTRAKDGFERRMMATSINQSYNQSEISNSMGQQSGGGFMGRISKMFNRR